VQIRLQLRERKTRDFGDLFITALMQHFENLVNGIGLCNRGSAPAQQQDIKKRVPHGTLLR
jgi:hypothetical protein